MGTEGLIEFYPSFGVEWNQKWEEIVALLQLTTSSQMGRKSTMMKRQNIFFFLSHHTNVYRKQSYNLTWLIWILWLAMNEEIIIV